PGYGVAQRRVEGLAEACFEQPCFRVAGRGRQSISQLDVVTREAIPRALAIQRHASCRDAHPGLERSAARVQLDLGLRTEQQAIPNFLQSVVHEISAAIDTCDSRLGDAGALALE